MGRVEIRHADSDQSEQEGREKTLHRQRNLTNRKPGIDFDILDLKLSIKLNVLISLRLDLYYERKYGEIEGQPRNRCFPS